MADNLGAASYRLILDARQFNQGAVTSAKAMRDVKQTMRDTTTPAEKLAARYDSVTAAFKRGEVPVKNYQRYLQQLNAEANKTAASVANLDARTTSLATSGKMIGGLGRGLSSVAGAFGVSLGAYGAVRLGASAIREAESFDQAMNSSLAIMKDVNAQIREDMEITARSVAYNTRYSSQEAAQAYYYLASAGLDAEQSIKALPTVAAFAQAGMFDLSRATDLVTDAQSALGLTVKDSSENLVNMKRVSDALVKANTLANASVEQFSEALTNKAAASMRMVGMELEEGLAVLAAFADQGLKGAEAGTAFSIVMRDLQTKAIENAEAFKEFGIEVFRGGELRRMSEILRDLEGRFASLTDEEKKSQLMLLGFSDKSLAYTQTLFGTADAIDRYHQGLMDIGGTAEEVAGKQLTPLQIATEQLKAEWSLFAKEVSTPIVTGLAGATEEVGMFAAALSSILEIQEFIAVAWRSMFHDIEAVSLLVKKGWLDVFGGTPEEYGAIADAMEDFERRASETLKMFTDESPKERYLRMLEEMRTATEEALPSAFSLAGRDAFLGIDAKGTDGATLSAQEVTNAVKEGVDVLKEYDKAATAAAAAIRKTQTPAEAFKAELEQIADWLMQGVISLEQFNELRDQSSRKMLAPAITTSDVGVSLNAVGSQASRLARLASSYNDADAAQARQRQAAIESQVIPGGYQQLQEMAKQGELMKASVGELRKANATLSQINERRAKELEVVEAF